LFAIIFCSGRRISIWLFVVNFNFSFSISSGSGLDVINSSTAASPVRWQLTGAGLQNQTLHRFLKSLYARKV